MGDIMNGPTFSTKDAPGPAHLLKEIDDTEGGPTYIPSDRIGFNCQKKDALGPTHLLKETNDIEDGPTNLQNRSE